MMYKAHREKYIHLQTTEGIIIMHTVDSALATSTVSITVSITSASVV